MLFAVSKHQLKRLKMDKIPLFFGRAEELVDLGRFLNKKSSSVGAGVLERAD